MEAFEEALRRAELTSAEVDYIEAHGTGTRVGDRSELGALRTVLNRHRDMRRKPCLIGSIKTNIGHTEGAAGVAGLLKALLTLKHGEVPPSLHFNEPNPNIEWDETLFTIPKALSTIGHNDRPIVAAVCSYGITGTLACLVMEAPALGTPTHGQPAAKIKRPPDEAVGDPIILPLSARSPEALKRYATSFADQLRLNPASVVDVAYSAALRRRHQDVRLACVGQDADALIEALENFTQGEATPTLLASSAAIVKAPSIGWVFSGQGSHWAGMGMELYDREPVFRAALDELDRLIFVQARFSVIEAIRAPSASSKLGQTEIAQPAIFALQVGVAKLLASWGFGPSMIVGHSVGEVAAAFMAGIMSLEDAVRVICARGQVAAKAVGLGKMAALEMGAEEAQALVADSDGLLDLAAINSPHSVTLSGHVEALGRACEQANARGLFARMLDVDYPSHGSLLEPLIPEMAAATSDVVMAVPTVPFISTVLGRLVVGDELGCDYWAKNLRQTVLFAPAIETLANAGCDLFVEIGPHPALAYSIKQALECRHSPVVVVETLRRDTSDAQAMKMAVGSHYVAGCDPDWSTLVPSSGGAISLPSYPWIRDRYWVDQTAKRIVNDTRFSTPHASETGLLQSRLALLGSDGPAYWQSDLSRDEFSWLDDHRVRDRATFPAAAYVSAALEAARSLVPNGCLADIEFHEALILPNDGKVRLQYGFLPDGEAGYYRLSVQAGDPIRSPQTRTHVTGRVTPARNVLASTRQPLDLTGASYGHLAIYSAMSNAQLQYSGEFAAIRSLITTKTEAVARLQAIPQGNSAAGLHPQTIDACLQVLLALTPQWGRSGDLWLPQAIKSVRIRDDKAIDAEMIAIAVGIPSLNDEDFVGDVHLLNSKGEVLLALEGVRLHKLVAVQIPGEILHEIRWEPRPLKISGALTVSQLAAIEKAVKAEGATVSEHASIRSTLNAADRLAAHSIGEALRSLGLDFASGRQFDLDEVIAEARIAPSHHRLLPRLLSILCEEGVLARDGDSWRVISPPAMDGLADLLDAELADASPETVAFWQLFSRASQRLAEVLSGRVDAVGLLFGDEGSAILETLYTEHLFWRIPLRQLATSLSLLSDTLASDKPISVIEIGAGTGGLTAHLLPKLVNRCERYAFTDRTPYFLNRARSRFASYPFFVDQLLDIEQDPQIQNFGTDEFDILAAANILHATIDLRQSLAHAAQLIKPGGFLLLQEEGKQERWTDLIFGLTDGWWRFQDRDLRPDHPLIDKSAWKEALDGAGFENVMVFGGERQDACGAIAIVAQKRKTPAPSRPWLLLADCGGVADALARLLCERGVPCSVVPSHGDHLDVLDDYLADRDEPGQVIVDLRPLDARLGDQEDSDALAQIEQRSVESLLAVLHPMLDSNRRHPPKLIIVTAAAQASNDDQTPLSLAQAPLWAVVRTARLENPGAVWRTIDIDGEPDLVNLSALAKELIYDDGETEIVLRHSRRFARRLSLLSESEKNLPSTGLFALEIEQRGTLDGFHAVPACPTPPAKDEVQIRVEAAGINFRDVLNLLGAVDQVPLGLECSGIVTSIGCDVTDIKVGEAVIAAGLGSWSSVFNTPAALVAPKPGRISHASAAALPIAYLTAQYALRHLAQVEPGQQILIHSIAGGVGLAALHIAKAAGADVLGTAGSSAKRDFARTLGAAQVFDSRSLQFAEDIRAGARPEVDVIINSFAGDFIPASLDLLAEGGTFIEIGKRDVWTHAQVLDRRPDISYHVVELAQVMRQTPGELSGMFRSIAQEVDAGALPPLPIRAFPASQALTALRFMQEARHTGKLVLTMPDRKNAVEASESRTKGAIMITGGLGGLGLATAQWLVEQGYRQILLLGRNGPDEAALGIIEALRNQGAEIWAERCDVGVHAEISELIARCGKDLPTLKGVFHLAGVLDDAPLHQLGADRFLSVYRPKMLGAWSLHRLTSDLDLDLFILFSSWTALLGSPGQANHSSANAFLDALAHYRRAQGLPAQSINWGGWRDVGAAADPVRIAHLARQGLAPMTSQTALRALGQVLSSDAIQVGISPFDPAVWRAAAGAMAGNVVSSDTAEAGLDSALHGASEPLDELTSDPKGQRPMREMLSELVAGPIRRNFLESQIKGRLSQVLRTPAKAFDVRKPFKNLGLDSLTALELRNMLESDTLLKLPASLIFNHNTIAKLAAELATQLGVPLDVDPVASLQASAATIESVRLGANKTGDDRSSAAKGDVPLREALREYVAGPMRRNFLEGQIKERLSQVLRTPAKAFDVRKPFKSLGLDSLTALELRNMLESDTLLKLPASFIFNHNNITKLATELATEMGVPLDSDPVASPQSSAAAEDEDVDALLNALQALPEEEALRLLSGEGR